MDVAPDFSGSLGEGDPVPGPSDPFRFIVRIYISFVDLELTE
jgi:hypothetical protein